MTKEMDREVLFARTLEKVKQIGRNQGGFIKKEQVEEQFFALNLDKSQMELIFDYLRKNHIGIDEPLDVKEQLTDKEQSYIQNYYDELEQLPSYSEGEKRAYTISAMAGERDAQRGSQAQHEGDGDCREAQPGGGRCGRLHGHRFF